MTDFERALVNSFNEFFEQEDIQGIAHRKKQHRFSSQLCDVLVDSKHDTFYLAIENKSVKTSSTNKLYFSQHFSESKNGHQIERITDFLNRSGRRGYLAVEFKRGRGKARKAYMVPWEVLLDYYESDEAGMPLEEIQEYHEIFRDSESYDLTQNMMEMFV
jgi:Holliday junction resolvase